MMIDKFASIYNMMKMIIIKLLNSVSLEDIEIEFMDDFKCLFPAAYYFMVIDFLVNFRDSSLLLFRVCPMINLHLKWKVKLINCSMHYFINFIINFLQN